MTFVRENCVDNLIQWDFLLEDETFLIEVIGLNYRTEVHLWAFKEFPEPDWDEFDSTLKGELAREAKSIGKTIGGFEKWHLFVNTHARLGIVASELEKELIELISKPTQFPDPDDRTDHEAYSTEVNGVFAKALRTMALATVLQSIAPVLGESAVNLLIHIAGRPALKKDSRLLEDALRRNIDVRIKRLPLECVGFARPIDDSREEFKAFLRLMNRRNDSLHGNVDPKRPVGDPLYFDYRTIMLVERHTPLVRQGCDQLMACASATSALEDLQTARNFVEFLLSHLQPEVRRDLDVSMEDLHLGFRPSDGRFGNILPRAFVDMHIPVGTATSNWLGEGI